MTDKTKLTLLSALITLFFSLQLASADMVSGPEVFIVAGIGLLIIIGILVGIIALISYIVIRIIRKKHHPLLNKPSVESKEATNAPK